MVARSSQCAVAAQYRTVAAQSRSSAPTLTMTTDALRARCATESVGVSAAPAGAGGAGRAVQRREPGSRRGGIPDDHHLNPRQRRSGRADPGQPGLGADELVEGGHLAQQRGRRVRSDHDGAQVDSLGHDESGSEQLDGGAVR